MRAVLEVRDFLVLFSVFVRSKVTINENISFADYGSGIRLLVCSKLTVNWKKDNDVTISWHDVIVEFFWRYFVSLVKFNGRSFMSISSLVLELWQFTFIRDWPEIPEIGNTPVLLLPDIWRLGRVRDTKFTGNISNEMLLNAAKCQGYSFYSFWIIK